VTIRARLALVPGSSSVAVPLRWRRLPVSKQGDDDYACGLHCIVTAAPHLGASPGRRGPQRILKAPTPPHAIRIQARLPAVGLSEKDIRALAAATGIALYRPNTHEVAQFTEPGGIWMAFVLVRFTAPTRAQSDERHYVLVLDHLADDGVLVVADPHPWNPSVYCVALDDFESAWRAAKAKGPPWAAALYRSG